MDSVLARRGRELAVNRDATWLVCEAKRFGWNIRRCLRAGSYFACSNGSVQGLVLKVRPSESRFSHMMMSELIMADRLGAVDSKRWSRDPSVLEVGSLLPCPRQPFLVVPLGSLRITPFALIRVQPDYVLGALDRHRRCDTGDWDALVGQSSNARDLLAGHRVQSLYRIGDDDLLCIVTEANRSQTTVLMAEDSWTRWE